MSNYKRKGHRGRHKKAAMDNQSQRAAGNGIGRGGRIKYAHRSASYRNVVRDDEQQ